MRYRIALALVWVVLLSVLSAPAAQAGWLVLRTGVAFETVGPWKTQDNWVNFTDKTTGKKKAVMIVTVDLEATREALLTGQPPKVDTQKRDGEIVIDDKKVAVDKNKKIVRDVFGALNGIVYCVNTFADDQQKAETCVRNLNLN